MIALMLLTDARVAVVDQVDGPAAALELAQGRIVFLEAACLPPGVREGDRLRLTLGRGDCPLRARAAGATRGRRVVP